MVPLVCSTSNAAGSRMSNATVLCPRVCTLSRCRAVPVCASKGFGSTSKSSSSSSSVPNKPKLHQAVDRSVSGQPQKPIEWEPFQDIENIPGACPCCSGKLYEDCCGPYHAAGAAAAPTPETALRARFSAFVKGNVDYLTASVHPDYLAFHYGAEMPLGQARQQLEADTLAACNNYEFKGFKVAPAEAPAAARSTATSPRGGARRGLDEARDMTVKCTYRQAPRTVPPAESPEWENTVQELCFRRRTSGAWQMTSYKQILNYQDPTALVARHEAEATGGAAGGAVPVNVRDWKLDPANRSRAGKAAAKPAA